MGGTLDTTDRWRVLGASVAGTSHADAGRPCADSCTVRELETGGGGSLLVAVAADGAGNSERAPDGARLACEVVVELAKDWAAVPLGARVGTARRDLSAFGHEQVRQWIETVRLRIAQAAEAEGREPRDFSCTLVVALVDETWAVFFQIGDGAVVYRCADGGLSLAFWPQYGEYANMTWFVTDEEAAERVQSKMVESVHELALLTDGLQGLALRFASREAHGPFFQPMFERLRGESDPELGALRHELARFLESSAVNERTDDDKTLILATRLAGQPTVSSEPVVEA